MGCSSRIATKCSDEPIMMHWGSVCASSNSERADAARACFHGRKPVRQSHGKRPTRSGARPSYWLRWSLGARAMTHNRDLVLIRKLCGLGLPAQTLAPSLLPALRQVIPSHSAAVFWVDERFEMTGLYAERLLPPDAM